METWPMRVMFTLGMALWKSLLEYQGCIRVGQAEGHHKNSLPDSEGDWTR